MFYIWCRIPHDLMLVMLHVVSSLMLIHRLQDHTQSMSSSKDEVPSASHYDSPPAHASEG